MIKEYIGSLGNRHNLTKYTLTNGVEVTLNEQEEEELFSGSIFRDNTIEELNEKIEDLELDLNDYSELKDERDDLENSVDYYKNQVQVLETKLERYQDIVKSFKDFQEKLSKVKG